MASFRGTDRYEVVRQLGTGGMGVVYEVLDKERSGQRLALKVLKHHDPESLMRLKREFRSLCGLRHPNVVALYDLVGFEDTWFFTQELIAGQGFQAWLAPTILPEAGLETVRLDRTASGPSLARLDPQVEPRLRGAFAQLAQAVAFLHQHGRVHRDIKPSNVLVEPDGRVVLLDFGLVRQLDDGGSISEARGHSVVGTVAYMAPEQAQGQAVGPPADWYAVGVMLFEALTGRLPFEGPALQVLADKISRPAPDAQALRAVPGDLSALCAALLRLRPEERPDARAVLDVLGVRASVPRASAPTPAERELVGREAELAVLMAALDRSQRGAPAMVQVVGTSGIGKSALLRHFSHAAAEQGALVVHGRCFEREDVPFKALDSLVDGLATRLANMEPERVDAVLPRDPHAMAAMFPVLARVPAIAQARSRQAADPHEQRLRAVQSLKELLGRMADRSPVVAILDDVQWGDAESARALAELLRPPDAPNLLVVLASRVEVSLPRVEGLHVDQVALAALPPEACQALARQLGTVDEARAQAIARDSGGNPFLLQELARSGPGEGATLEAIVTGRLDALPAPSRALLDVVAVASAPLAVRVALEAAGLKPAHFDTVEQLKAAHLIKGLGDGERIETWHDRIRETALQVMSPQRAQDLHYGLAEAMRVHTPKDIDAIAWHLGAAGRSAEAAEATVFAAQSANEQLAFERAAVLYRRALELLPAEDPRRGDTTAALGDALAAAGRGPEAAAAYQRATVEPGRGQILPSAALELKRRAAEQLMRSGRIDDGLAVIDEVLSAVKLGLARTPVRALVSLLFRRARLWLRGLGYVERPESQVPRELITQIDVCWSMSLGLAMVDTIRGYSFQAKQLLLALDAGEPWRVARALAAEAAFAATAGSRARVKAQGLIDRASGIAVRMGDPQLFGLVDFCSGTVRFLSGRWREALQPLNDAERHLRDAGLSVSWEAVSSRLFSMWCLYYVGDLGELKRRVPSLVADAESRGDLYAVASLKTGLSNIAHLVGDSPDAARADVEAVLKEWSSRGYQFQHYWGLLSLSMIDLYQGSAEKAWRRAQEEWPRLKGSQLLRIENVRVEATSLMGRLALASGRGAEVQRAVDRLAAEPVAWAHALAALLRGLTRGPGAEGHLRDARERFEREGMMLFATVARLRHGELVGGEAGAESVHAATAWLIQQQVEDPQALARTAAPWLATG